MRNNSSFICVNMPMMMCMRSGMCMVRCASENGSPCFISE